MMGRNPGRRFALIVVIVLVPSVGRAAWDPWTVHAAATLGVPVAPAEFRDGAKAGLGITAGVRRVVGGPWSLGLEGEFVQFGRGDVAGADLTGGERRFGRIGVPLRVIAWEHDGLRRTRLDLEASAGYAHASRTGVSGTATTPERPNRADGFGWTAGAALSGRLYQATRWMSGLRAGGSTFPEESPLFLGIVIGIEAAPARR